jgi:hypothetical protein
LAIIRAQLGKGCPSPLVAVGRSFQASSLDIGAGHPMLVFATVFSSAAVAVATPIMKVKATARCPVLAIMEWSFEIEK